MTLVKHELRQGRVAFWVWTVVLAFLLATCVFLYPQMKGEMDRVSDLFASMGSFTDAFGMDKLNFGTLIGYYAIECGNTLGLGGAFFAALTAVSALCGEEKNRTAEFLLTHPVSRTRVAAEKLISVLLRMIGMNLVVFALSLASVAAVGEEIPWRELCLLHLAHCLMCVEIAGICFGVSAFLRGGGAGVGVGAAALFYVANLLANVTEKAGFLKYLTPFGFCDGADLVSEGLDWAKVAVGLAMAAAAVIAAFWYYPRKDIH